MFTNNQGQFQPISGPGVQGSLKQAAGQRSAFDVGIATKRKVVNVRRFNEITGEVTNEAPTNPTFQWLTNASQAVKENAAPASNGVAAAANQELQSTDAKPTMSFQNSETAKEAPKNQYNYFGQQPKTEGNPFSKPAVTTQQNSLFGGPPPSGGLFGGPPKTASLFGEPPKQGGLFGGQTSLFGGGGAAQGQSSLFGQPAPAGGQTSSLFSGAPPGGSLFGQSNSLFGNPAQNMFNKGTDQQNQNQEDDDGMYKNDEDEPPAVTLDSNYNQPNNPFTKQFDKVVDKFKYIVQATKTNEESKHNCGNGKVSIEFGKLGDSQMKIYKIVFRNAIGKTLYEANINAKVSKSRRVPEKAQKNQFKIAVIKLDPQTAPQRHFVLINFQRNEDLDGFENTFKEAIKDLQK